MRNADGTGNAERVCSGFAPSISQDGRFLVHTIDDEEGKSDIMYLELTGNREQKTVLATQESEWDGCISRDGNYISYTSDESGRDEVYITRFPSAEGKWQVSTNGGLRSRWSRDGKFLYYQTQDGDLMEVGVELGTAPVLDVPTRVVDYRASRLVTAFGREYEISLDGTRFLWNQSSNPDKSMLDLGITLVENWSKEFVR